MKIRVLFFVLLVILLIFTIIFVRSFEKKKINSVRNEKLTPSVSIIPSPTLALLGSKCQINGVLPDAKCTPGAIDPNVTQDNIFDTICKRGYTATIRPPVEYTNKLKREQIREYGYQDTNLKDYEEDHLISLELGGSPSDPKNLWPEPGASPNDKDKVENLCHEKVCSGQISLSEAQRQIATNWTTACL